MQSLSSFLEPPLLVPFQFPSETVDEGSYVQIGCSVIKGDEPLQISWSLQGDVISSDPSITTTMLGTRSSILIISQVGYRHAGDYSCRATNKAGSNTHSATLRVNGIRVGGGLREIRVTLKSWIFYLIEFTLQILQGLSPLALAQM